MRQNPLSHFLIKNFTPKWKKIYEKISHKIYANEKGEEKDKRTHMQSIK
jgi:hypothetical protein